MREKQRRQEGDEEEDAATDGDVLVVGLERLPPPGIEQVFEADADADDDSRAHRRPRPKLSRAERIAAAKARRAAAADVITSSGLGLSMFALDQETDAIGAGAEGPKRWGSPGGDVVQELKDVIWKVGEQRRLREEKQQLEEMEKQQVASADVEVVSVGSVGSVGDTVVTREPPWTLEDVFASPPQLPSTVVID